MTIGKSLLNKKTLVTLVIAVILLATAGFFLLNGTNKQSNITEKPKNTTTRKKQLVIKDLGVEITLPDELAGTAIETKTLPAKNKIKPAPIVNFSVEAYSSQVSNCLGSKYEYKTPYASLVRISGKAASDDSLLMKQFDSFHIDKLSDNLKLTCKDQPGQAAFDGITKRYNQVLKDAFINAQLTK
jgi:hypothetical protein